MLSVKAIYDGEHLKLLEPVFAQSPQEVIVTFLRDVPTVAGQETDISGADMQQLAGQSPAFLFLLDDREDVYTDADLKVTY